MRTGGQTDMAKLMVAFRNFAEAPKNYNIVILNLYNSEQLQV
jgi:hypothetical protein